MMTEIDNQIDEPTLRAIEAVVADRYFVVADQVWSMGVDAERRLRPLPAEQVDALLTRWFTRQRALVA